MNAVKPKMLAKKLFTNHILFRSMSKPLSSSITTSQLNKKSFKVQDEEDFNERVKKCKTPVIVDFFAT